MAKRGKISGFQTQEAEGRPVRIKKYQYLFLIVCEDEKTEPSYFSKFGAQIPPKTIYLKPVGTGRDAKGVVTQAIQERLLLEQEADKEVDEVWVVYDKDDADLNETRLENFHQAFKIARKENMEIAYSNEAFELWLLLHFASVSSEKPIARSEIYEALQAEIRKKEGYANFEYDHKRPDPTTVNIVFAVGNLAKAMERAEQLAIHHAGKAPIAANPSTTVHRLVQTLQGWIRYYGYSPD